MTSTECPPDFVVDNNTHEAIVVRSPYTAEQEETALKSFFQFVHSPENNILATNLDLACLIISNICAHFIYALLVEVYVGYLMYGMLTTVFVELRYAHNFPLTQS